MTKKFYWIVSCVIVLLLILLLVIDFENISTGSGLEGFEEQIDRLEKSKNLTTEESLHLAILYSNQGEVGKEKEILQGILKEEPNNEDAIYRLSNVALKEHDVEESIRLLETYIELTPTNSSGYYYYALSLLVQDIEKANAMMYKAYELSSKENKDFLEGHLAIIQNIITDKSKGYKELLANEEIYLPEVIRLEIEGKLNVEGE